MLEQQREKERVLNLGSVIDFQAEIQFRLGLDAKCSVRITDGEKDYSVLDVEINHSILEASWAGNVVTVSRKCQRDDEPVEIPNMLTTVFRVPKGEEDAPGGGEAEYSMVFERVIRLCKNKKMQRLQLIHAVSDAVVDVYRSAC